MRDRPALVGDGAEVEWIVDDRHEEVGRRNDRLILADAIDRRVIAILDADEQIGMNETSAAGTSNELFQHRRGELAAAPSPM